MKYAYAIVDLDIKILNKLGRQGWYLAVITPDGKVIMMKRIAWK